jgi:hypothetical protein
MPGVYDSIVQATKLHRKLVLVSIVGWIFCLIISWKVWIPSNTFFPSLPIIDLFHFEDSTTQWVFSISFFIGFLLFLFQKNRVINLFGLFIIILFIIGDYNRIQPWFYYFLLIIFISKLWPRQKEFEKLGAISFLFVTVYVLSGIQKCHANFALTTFPWLVEPITNNLLDSYVSVLHSLWWLAPLIETAAGIGLLFSQFRKKAAYILIGMHAIILLAIGPLGHNTNMVVWPWNIGFIAIL